MCGWGVGFCSCRYIPAGNIIFLTPLKLVLSDYREKR